MSRSLTTAAEAASLAEVYRPVVFVELDFSGGFVRVNSSPYSLTFSSNVFLGVGKLGEITPVEEVAEIRGHTIALRLYGIPPDLAAMTLTETYKFRPARIWLGFLDDNHAVIADPVMIFAGIMETLTPNVGEDATVTVQAVSRLRDWERPRRRNYTTEDQAIDYAGDKGFEYVAAMVEKTVSWGRT